MHAKQGATKTEQSRRKLRNETTVFMGSYFYFVTGKNKNKLYGGATTNYIKK